MKKLFVTLVGLCLAFTTTAQNFDYYTVENQNGELIRVFFETATNGAISPPQEVAEAVRMPEQGVLRGGTDTCATDTLEYPLFAKATALQLWQIDGTGYLGFSQYYDAPEPLIVEGVKFYGHVMDNAFNSDTVTVWAKLYAANPADSLPLGAAIDSTEVDMVKYWNGSNIEEGAYVATFDNAQTVSSAYLVSLEYTGPDTIITMSNSVTLSDGAGENLGFYNYAGYWYRNIDFILFDADWIIHPIVRYEFLADFSILADSICLPDNMCVANMASAVLDNRMYNQDAANPSHTYTWGDGTLSTAADTCHLYAGPNDYVIEHTIFQNGWNVSCIHASSTTVNVGAKPEANFGDSVVAGVGTVHFSDSTLGDVDDYLWDFGDFAGTSTDQNPIYTYSNSGLYNVFLFATNRCGTDTVNIEVNVIVGALEESGEAIDIRAYPNPTSLAVQLDNPTNKTLQLQVYSADGKLMHTSQMAPLQVHRIEVNAWAAGTYFIQVRGKDLQLQQQIQVVR